MTERRRDPSSRGELGSVGMSEARLMPSRTELGRWAWMAGEKRIRPCISRGGLHEVTFFHEVWFAGTGIFPASRALL